MHTTCLCRNQGHRDGVTMNVYAAPCSAFPVLPTHHHAELRLPEPHPHPVRPGQHCQAGQGRACQRARAAALWWWQRAQERHAGRSESCAGHRRHRPCQRIQRHRAQPHLRDADARRAASQGRADRLPAGRGRRVRDRRHQVRGRRGCAARRRRSLEHPAHRWPRREVSPALRLGADAARHRLRNEQRRRHHQGSHARQAALLQPLHLPAVLGAGPHQDLHPSQAPGRQRRGRCVRAHYRTVPDLPCQRPRAGPLCRGPAAHAGGNRPGRREQAGGLRHPRQPDVDCHPGAERPDRCRRAAGLGHAHDWP